LQCGEFTGYADEKCDQHFSETLESFPDFGCPGKNLIKKKLFFATMQVEKSYGLFCIIASARGTKALNHFALLPIPVARTL